MVFDIADGAKFEDKVKREAAKIARHAPEGVNVWLVGANADCWRDDSEKAVSQSWGEKIALEHGMGYLETSARTGEGVEECFEKITRGLPGVAP